MDATLFVFGYGSLMWNPGFPHVDVRPARVRGYHRSLCIYSHIYRGTPERPGLVFGLDRGGACRGLAFEVAPADRAATIAYLREREQVTDAYREVMVPADLADGRRVAALTYVVNRANVQYAGRLAHAAQLALVRHGVGRAGPNTDYVRATAEHLRRLGIRDRGVERLVEELDGLPPQAAGAAPA